MRAVTATSKLARWCAMRRPSAVPRSRSLLPCSRKRSRTLRIRRFATAVPSAGRSRSRIRQRNCPPASWRSEPRSSSTGRTGRRSVAADEFFKGLFETALGPGDVLTAIRIAVPRSGARFGFAELARRHGDYALVGLAATATADGGKLGDVRLAFFGVGDCATRARRAETALEAGDLDAAVAALQYDLSPPSDVHASAATRRHLAGVLLRRVAAQLDSST